MQLFFLILVLEPELKKTTLLNCEVEGSWIRQDKITLLYLFRISLFTKLLRTCDKNLKMYYHKSTKIRKILKAGNDKIN